ncbi:hypothetical protein; putative exported protein [Xenorhabdus bovienii SS-2004]|uniref:Uncharacterized protein n=1 Tax=Xenorhabdus bovienii (strain SS-2004) TaxID=406818 RepID=D3V6U1_XENBS|nr:hypothetical protein; putative exported protein [Xenorhabdus bovienii SS-2004]
MIELINKSLYARGNKTIKFIKKITITSSFRLWAVNSQYSSSETSTALLKDLLQFNIEKPAGLGRLILCSQANLSLTAV